MKPASANAKEPYGSDLEQTLPAIVRWLMSYGTGILFGLSVAIIMGVACAISALCSLICMPASTGPLTEETCFKHASLVPIRIIQRTEKLLP